MIEKIFHLVRIFSAVLIVVNVNLARAETYAWEQKDDCKINKPNSKGLYQDALTKLTTLHLNHRITQALNTSSVKSNYHNVDSVVGGHEYTAAVDLSVRCLNVEQIRNLLSKLATAGFAGWYRVDGMDGWKDSPHIHAIWVKGPMKQVLQRQVESWLNGRNGLSSNLEYKFWQPSDQEREMVRNKYKNRQ